MKIFKFKTDNKRIFGLDIIRAFAIMTVLFGHGFSMIENTALKDFPYFQMMDGVDLFFVLSGFLIGGIILKDINRNKSYGIKDLTRFWKRRWFRTLPNYYLILFINFVFTYFRIIPGDYKKFDYSFFIFTQNFRFPLEGFFLESWSLAVEEWFYLIVPIIIYFLFKRFPAKKAFLFTILIMIILPILYRIKIYQPVLSDYEWSVTFRKTVLSRLDSIGYGLLCAWVYYYYKDFWRKIRIPSLIIGLLIFYYVKHYAPGEFYRQVILFILSPLVMMFIMPFAESIKTGKGIIAYFIQHLSKISYSMYLINLGIVANIINLHFPPEAGIDGIIKYLIYWFLVIFLSTLLYKYFEKPMMDLRDRDISFKKILRSLTTKKVKDIS